MGPPTAKSRRTCPTCNGQGSLIVFDRAAMIRERKALGISQAAVARAAGWQGSVVSELESGTRPMTEASAQRYWKALHDAAEKQP